MKAFAGSVLVVYLMSGTNICNKEKMLPDTVKPKINITSPFQNQETISGDSIYIDVLFEDDNKIDSVIFASIDITDPDSSIVRETDTLLLKAISYKYYRRLVYRVEAPRLFNLYFWVKDTAGNSFDTSLVHHVELPD